MYRVAGIYDTGTDFITIYLQIDFAPGISYIWNDVEIIVFLLWYFLSETHSRTLHVLKNTFFHRHFRCTRKRGQETGSCRQIQSYVWRLLQRTDLHNRHVQIYDSPEKINNFTIYLKLNKSFWKDNVCRGHKILYYFMTFDCEVWSWPCRVLPYLGLARDTLWWTFLCSYFKICKSVSKTWSGHKIWHIFLATSVTMTLRTWVLNATGWLYMMTICTSYWKNALALSKIWGLTWLKLSTVVGADTKYCTQFWPMTNCQVWPCMRRGWLDKNCRRCGVDTSYCTQFWPSLARCDLDPIWWTFV